MPVRNAAAGAFRPVSGRKGDGRRTPTRDTCSEGAVRDDADVRGNAIESAGLPYWRRGVGKEYRDRAKPVQLQLTQQLDAALPRARRV